MIEKSRLRMKLEKAEARLHEVPAGVAETVRLRLARAQQALDRAVDLWHEVDAKRLDLLARGRTASSDIARSWKETLRESRASLSAARHEWREAARLLSRIPEQT